MKFQPTIARQGLLLITIPLVFEIIFVLSLTALLKQGDEQRKEFVRSTDFMAEVIELTENVMESVLCLSVWKTTRSEEFAKKFDNAIARLPAINDKLTLISRGDQRREQHVASLKSSEERIYKLISGFRRPSAVAMLLLMDPVVYRRDLSNATGNFVNETTAIADEEKEKQNHNPGREERLHLVLSWTLALGVLLNVAISFIMVRIFSRRITERLGVVTDNCRRFVARNQLNEPVGGQDEIADLDLHIHDMANVVRAAEIKRDEYVQMVNHDLRAPLAAIQTILAGTLKGLYGELTEKGKSRLTDARLDASRLLDLINETMEIDRLDSGQFQLNLAEFDLSELITEVIGSLRPLLEQKQITVEYKPATQVVTADRPRLFRVLANLVDNAVKYSNSSSKIQIIVHRATAEVLTEVNDEGQGIAPCDVNRMFKAYERGPEDRIKNISGKGLGLAICKTIVEAHRGRIGVKNRTGRGTTFWFTLPSK